MGWVPNVTFLSEIFKFLLFVWIGWCGGWAVSVLAARGAGAAPYSWVWVDKIPALGTNPAMFCSIIAQGGLGSCWPWLWELRALWAHSWSWASPQLLPGTVLLESCFMAIPAAFDSFTSSTCCRNKIAHGKSAIVSQYKNLLQKTSWKIFMGCTPAWKPRGSSQLDSLK